MKYTLYAISLSLVDYKHIQKLNLGKRDESITPYFSGCAVYYTDDFEDPISMLKEKIIKQLKDKIKGLNSTIKKISEAKLK